MLFMVVDTRLIFGVDVFFCLDGEIWEVGLY